MNFSVTQAAITFIACHGGPADHFATFAQNLPEIGSVKIYASGPALKKFQERGIEVHPFSIDNISSEEEDILAQQIAKACSASSVVITDVGHCFDIKMQKALACQITHVRRLAYYDNPEPYVPGGYSQVASQVMLASEGILFANSKLAESSIFQEQHKEIDFTDIKKIGIGYYPIGQSEKIARRRAEEKTFLRQQFLAKNNLIENEQKIFVYFGGNNDEYFGKAFPAFLSLIAEGIEQFDFSNTVFIIQQHPGAKEKNFDARMVSEWISKYEKMEKAPKVIISDFNSDNAQILADMAFYYQTSMGPQFALAGIPTVQIGHEMFEDILVRNDLSPSVTNSSQLIDVIAGVHSKKEISQEVIFESLGIKNNWFEIFKTAIGFGKK